MITPKEFLSSYVEKFNTNTEWSFSGTGPDGKPVNIAGKAADVLRQQSDGTWRILIDNPWGADLQIST